MDLSNRSGPFACKLMQSIYYDDMPPSLKYVTESMITEKKCYTIAAVASMTSTVVGGLKYEVNFACGGATLHMIAVRKKYQDQVSGEWALCHEFSTFECEYRFKRAHTYTMIFAVKAKS